jgi:long-subunit fatty acid transport protein
MKPSLLSTAVAAASLSLISSVAMAGGMDRSGMDTSIIMDSGNVVETTQVSVKPTITGTYATAFGGTATGDVAPDYSMTNIGVKMDVTDNIAIAVINDSPYGSDLNWTSGALSGTKATIGSSATTLIGSYKLDGGMTVFGGVRDQEIDVEAGLVIPATITYAFAKASTSATGYLAGVGFEKPEIALKVSLTYNAKVKHTITANETVNGNPVNGTASFYMPSSYNLDFQTGVAENTLLFGTIRRANWTETDVRPNGYLAALSKSLLTYSNDSTTYNIGLGRKFSETWSGAITYGYEAAQSGTGSPTSPTNGNSKYGIGVTYNAEDFSATLGVQHVDIGDQQVMVGANSTPMTGNTALVTALKISAKF